MKLFARWKETSKDMILTVSLGLKKPEQIQGFNCIGHRELRFSSDLL